MYQKRQQDILATLRKCFNADCEELVLQRGTETIYLVTNKKSVKIALDGKGLFISQTLNFIKGSPLEVTKDYHKFYRLGSFYVTITDDNHIVIIDDIKKDLSAQRSITYKFF